MSANELKAACCILWATCTYKPSRPLHAQLLCCCVEHRPRSIWFARSKTIASLHLYFENDDGALDWEPSGLTNCRYQEKRASAHPFADKTSGNSNDEVEDV